MPQFPSLYSSQAMLLDTGLEHWLAEPQVLDYGALVVCRSGRATMRVDFVDWEMCPGAVMVLFPDDVVAVRDADREFSVEMLCYGREMLREASLQLEHTVYSWLRGDRLRAGQTIVTDIIDNMFALLKIYFAQPECRCLDMLVFYQLKAFFTGFYDWTDRNRDVRQSVEDTSRTREQFNKFMQLLSAHYRQAHDVAFYARRLNITGKYLNTIVRRVTQQNAKAVIDQYVVLKLKLELRSGNLSVKQIAWDYDFSDASFLCRYFRKHTGFTPQQYRAALAEQPLP